MATPFSQPLLSQPIYIHRTENLFHMYGGAGVPEESLNVVRNFLFTANSTPRVSKQNSWLLIVGIILIISTILSLIGIIMVIVYCCSASGDSQNASNDFVLAFRMHESRIRQFFHITSVVPSGYAASTTPVLTLQPIQNSNYRPPMPPAPVYNNYQPNNLNDYPSI